MNIIFEQKPYRVTLQNKADFDVVDLLKHTQWGTKETVYQRKDSEKDIMRVPDPLFFSLEKQDELIGTCCFSRRIFSIHGRTYDCWYGKYFSIDSKRQGGIFGHMILKNIRMYFEKQTEMPTVFYAYVDASNQRSHKLITHIGFQQIRSFQTLTFSRLYPKKDKRVSLINEEDTDEMLLLLNEAYKEYSFARFDKQYFKTNYFVLKIEDEIIAGIHVTMAHWIIRSLSGIAGKLIIKLVPHIPILSKLFNPKDFRFAAFDGIYYKAGFEKEFFILMESVCASLNVCTGITWLDSESLLYTKLKSSGSWGIMEKIKDNIPAHVVAAFKNISHEEQERIHSAPAYIAAADII